MLSTASTIIGATLSLIFVSASALSDDTTAWGGAPLSEFASNAVTQAKEIQCENANIVVYSKSRHDAVLGCEGAERAILLLGTLGLVTKGMVKLHIVDVLPRTNDSSILGFYSRAKLCAYLLSFSEVKKRGTAFDVPLDSILYRSMAAHEVSHIIIKRNFSIQEPQIKAKKYIAYFAMFAQMPTNYRMQLLEKLPYTAFDTEWDINAILYMLDPVQFGVSAYKHYLKLKDKRTFVQRILSGQALATELLY